MTTVTLIAASARGIYAERNNIRYLFNQKNVRGTDGRKMQLHFFNSSKTGLTNAKNKM